MVIRTPPNLRKRMKVIERHIDYLQMNIHLSERDFSDKEFDVVPPIKFYKRGFRNTNGTRFYFGNPNSKKCCVVMSGFALLFERLNYRNDAALLDFWLTKGATVSRLDLAVTEWIEDDLFTLADVEMWYKKGLIDSIHCAGGCKKIEQILQETPNVPETLYIGDIKARGRKGIFRAYDKGVESGLVPNLATRIELEFKGDNAQSTAKRVASDGDISGNFRAKFNVNDQSFERLMDAPSADTTRNKANPKREQTEEMAARWKWLLEIVAPALREAVNYDRQTDALDANLTAFLVRSGIHGEIKHHVNLLTDRMIADKLDTIDLNDFSDWKVERK